MEDARRASLADEEARWMRVVASTTGASSSRNVEIVEALLIVLLMLRTLLRVSRLQR